MSIIIERTLATVNLDSLIEEIAVMAKYNFVQRYNLATKLLRLDVDDGWLAADDAELDLIIATHNSSLVLLSTEQHWEPGTGVQESPDNVWVNAFEVTAEPLLAGDYHIHVGAELRGKTGGLNSRAMGRFSINGNNKANWRIPEASSDWTTVNGFDLQPYAHGATPTIKIEFRKVGGTDIVQIRKIRVVLINLT